MKKNRIPRYVSPNVKQLENDREDVTVFRVVGVPFGGPDYLQGKDLEGEYFDTNTNLGKDSDGNVTVDTVYAYYHHALHSKIGQELIGYAKYVKETDEGQVWDLEVRRAFLYHDMLLALSDKGLLGASSQPVQTSVKIDWDSGHIDQWHVAEISLTPTPANPNAVVDVLKSHDISQEVLDVVLDLELDEPEVDEPEVEETENLAGEIDELFSEDLAKSGQIEQLVEQINALTVQVETLGTGVVEIKTQMTENHEETKTALKTAMTALDVVKSGLKSFAVNVAKQLKFETRNIAEELGGMSEEEQEAEDKLKIRTQDKSSYLPTNAPGRN
jgi:hypothetical protein